MAREFSRKDLAELKRVVRNIEREVQKNGTANDEDLDKLYNLANR